MTVDAGVAQGQEPAGNQQQPTGQEPGSGSGQEPTGQPQGGQQQDAGNDNQPQTPSLDGITDPVLRSYVERQIADAAQARQEAARYRTERNALTEQQQAAQRAQETAEQTAQREAQEARDRAAALEAENRELKVGSQWTEAAREAKALDPKALLALVGGLEKVTLDDQGKATNLDALLATARTTYPWAFSRTSGDGGAGNGAGQQPVTAGGVNDLIRGGTSRPVR